MSKKDKTKKINLKISDNEDLFKAFISKSKDGLVIGSRTNKGKYYTAVADKKTGNFSIHRTEVQPNGTKKYPERMDFKHFLEVLSECIRNPLTKNELLEILSDKSKIIPLTIEDFDIENFMKEKENEVDIDFLEFFKNYINKYEASEKLEKKNFESIVNKYPKGFIIENMGKNNKSYFIIPKYDDFIIYEYVRI